MILGIFFALRVIVRTAASSLKEPGKRTFWRSAGFIIFTWLSVVLLAAESTAASGSGSANAALQRGIVDGYSRTAKPSDSRKLAISILYILLLPYVFYSTILREDPLKISVAPNEVALLYRLPWRDRSIRLTDVTNVRLERHNTREPGGPDYFYIFVIEHDGIKTDIHCNHRTWYEGQLVAAYEAIKSQLVSQGRGSAATRTTN